MRHVRVCSHGGPRPAVYCRHGPHRRADWCIREHGASIGFMAKTSHGSDDDDATLPEPDFPQWFSAFLWPIARPLVVAAHRQGIPTGLRCDRQTRGCRSRADRRTDTRGDHEGGDAGGVRRLRRHPLGGLDPALLVDVEHLVHLPVHRGAPRRQSDAIDRSPEGPQIVAEGTWRRDGLRKLPKAIDADKRFAAAQRLA